MSKAVVKFRDQDNAVEYPVDRVMPFGSQCVAVQEGDTTLIFPVARLTEMVLIAEEDNDAEVIIQDS